MTRQEFETQFNELIGGGTIDLDKASKFRADVLADYDASAVHITTLSNTKTRIEELEKENGNLKHTNLQLFMMNPMANNSANNQQNTGKNNQQENNQNNEPDGDELTPPETPSVDAVISSLLGKKDD